MMPVLLDRVHQLVEIMHSVQTISGANLSLVPMAEHVGLFQLAITGQHQQVQAAQGVLTSILQ